MGTGVYFLALVLCSVWMLANESELYTGSQKLRSIYGPKAYVEMSNEQSNQQDS